MKTDATGHGTQDTGHDPRPVLRAPAPDTEHPGVPPTNPTQDTVAGHGTRDTDPRTPRDTPPPDKRDVPQDSLLTRSWARYTAHRAAKNRAAGHQKVLEDASRAARDAERDVERDALSRAAVSRRASSRGRTAEQRDDQIAPIPKWMKITGVWVDRTFGAIPLLAPLIVSGFFTMHVFTDAPLSVVWGIALCITLALEGGVWKLSRIYEKTLLEGDSTIGIRAVIGLYLALISGMIYGHAYYLAWKDAGGDTDTVSKLAMDWSKWAPAAGIAVMSFLGVMVWSKEARYKHRVKLREQGQVDPRAPKFATLAWVLTPLETFGAVRHAVRYRITSPVDAVADRRLYRAAGRPTIWPIPPGFAWINGTLVQIDPLMGREVQDAVPLEAEHRPALDNDTHGTPGRVINGTFRGGVPQLPAGHNGTRDTTNSTGHHGTARDSDGATGDPDHGTQDSHGTRDSDGTQDTDDLADVLKYAEHLIAVTDAFRDWQTTVPSVRKITAAIDQSRRERDGGSYNSNATSAKVQEALVKLRQQPQLLDVMRPAQKGEQE